MKGDQTGFSYVRGNVLHDVMANFLGRGLGIFLSFLLVPFVVKVLGIEAYGLVGFYMTLQAVLLLLDFGFSLTLNRQLSSIGDPPVPNQVISLSRYLERLFVVMAIILFGAVLVLAPWLSSDWMSYKDLSKNAVAFSVVLMGSAIAFQLLFLLYSGGLNGLGLQVKCNVILGVSSILRYGGAFVLLGLIPRIEVFFTWMTVSGFVQVLWARTVFDKALKSKLDFAEPNIPVRVSQHVGFAAGVGTTAVLGVVLTQLDKVLLSKLLPLEEYGHYTLAWTLSAMLFVMAMPITTAFFPRLSAYSAQKNTDPSNVYHDGSQLLAVAVMPVTVMLIVFPEQILNMWLGSKLTAGKINGLLVLLTVGTALNTLAYLPHALQLAYGKAKFGLYANIVMVALAFPALIFGVSSHGVMGAAWVWVGVNFLYVSIGIPLMHLWLLRGEFFNWSVKDVLLPFLAAFSVGLFCSRVVRFGADDFWANILLLFAVYLAALAASLLAAPRARTYLLKASHVLP